MILSGLCCQIFMLSLKVSKRILEGKTTENNLSFLSLMESRNLSRFLFLY